MATNLHISARLLNNFVSELPKLYSPGEYQLDHGWTLHRESDHDTGEQSVQLTRGQYELTASGWDNDPATINTNILLAVRIEKATDDDPTLALALLMIAIDQEFELDLFEDDDFADMVARVCLS